MTAENLEDLHPAATSDMIRVEGIKPVLTFAPRVKHHLVAQASSVEAWTDHLPYCGAGPESAQRRRQAYHQELCAALGNLGANVASTGGLRAGWVTERRGKREPDTENLLIWEVGSSLPRLTEFLCFERRVGPLPPPPAALEFRARHYLRYEAALPALPDASRKVLIQCAPVVCDPTDLKITFELWRRFKPNVMCTDLGKGWRPGNPFDVEITIFGPQRVNLADWQMVKSVVDAFIMSLHYYEGDQLDQVSERIKDKFGGEAAYWRDLLLNRDHAVLGSQRAPFIKRSYSLAWSPADDLLVRCEFTQEQSPDGRWSVAGKLIGR